MSVVVRIAVYCLLLAIGIPWYWPDDGGRVVLGLPAWVLAALLVMLFRQFGSLEQATRLIQARDAAAGTALAAPPNPAQRRPGT